MLAWRDARVLPSKFINWSSGMRLTAKTRFGVLATLSKFSDFVLVLQDTAYHPGSDLGISEMVTPGTRHGACG